jgi:HD-GYP domain-containing protein (c-di-GMP phosphodiesterase class II)
MKSKDMGERLKAVVRDPDREVDVLATRGNYRVTISGLTKTSKEALLGRDLMVRHFPFTIGRSHFGSGFSRGEPDFPLQDTEPVRISRRHLTLELRDGRISLTGRTSRFGSLVNGEPLGKKAGGSGRISLTEGNHEVILGGRSSRLIFRMEVRRSKGTEASDDYVKWGNHIIPVAAHYIRLCLAAKEVIYPSSLGARERIAKALKLSADIAKDPKSTEMLHGYSAHPHTFSDVIAAHSINVAIYAIRLAAGRAFPKQDLVWIGAAALLHDIGMYTVPSEIVHKTETITREEFEVIKRHTEAGYADLSAGQDPLSLVPTAAHEHHERVDGSGYPSGKKDLDERVELLGLVDFFEAVTHHRPQRGAVTPHQGMRMLVGMKYEPFSPRLLKTFLSVFSLFPVFSVVRLNSGELAQVIRSNRDWILRPVVRLLLDRHGNPVEETEEIDLSREKSLFITKDISDRVFIDSYFRI